MELIFRKNLWMPDEDDVVVRHYPDFKAMTLLLPGRTKSACGKRAYILKLSKTRRSWTGAEIIRFRKAYTSLSLQEVRELFPYLTMHAIRAKARDLQIKRPRLKHFKSSGHPMIDAIRDRAFLLNYTMRDLDEECHTCNYFNGQCHSRPVSFQAIYKAVDFLGGEIRLHWPD